MAAGKVNITGVCRLCERHEVLRNSHIYPEFLFTHLYDAKHRAPDVPPTGNLVTIQKGLRERLLCDSCEKRLSPLEDYFCREWCRPKKWPTSINGNTIRIEELDYKRFKLFILSVLWRASVSELPDYRSADLGPHNDMLRRMLIDQNPGPQSKYTIFGGVLVWPQTYRVCRAVITGPIHLRMDGRHVYQMVFGGGVWDVIVSHPSSSSHAIDPYALQEDGSITMQRMTVLDLLNGGTLVPKHQLRMLQEQRRKKQAREKS